MVGIYTSVLRNVNYSTFPPNQKVNRIKCLPLCTCYIFNSTNDISRTRLTVYRLNKKGY